MIPRSILSHFPGKRGGEIPDDLPNMGTFQASLRCKDHHC